MNGTQHQQIENKQEYNQRLRESSKQANIWENTIGPSLSVIPGHSTSSGQCSPVGRKDKVCKWPRSWWAARDNWNVTYNVWQPSKKSSLMTNLSVRHMQTREHHYSYVLGHKSFITLDRIMAPQHFWNKSLVKASGLLACCHGELHIQHSWSSWYRDRYWNLTGCFV